MTDTETHTHGYYLTGLVSRFGQRWEPQGFPLKTTSAKKIFLQVFTQATVTTSKYGKHTDIETKTHIKQII